MAMSWPYPQGWLQASGDGLGYPPRTGHTTRFSWWTSSSKTSAGDIMGIFLWRFDDTYKVAFPQISHSALGLPSSVSMNDHALGQLGDGITVHGQGQDPERHHPFSTFSIVAWHQMGSIGHRAIRSQGGKTMLPSAHKRLTELEDLPDVWWWPAILPSGTGRWDPERSSRMHPAALHWLPWSLPQFLALSTTSTIFPNCGPCLSIAGALPVACGDWEGPNGPTGPRIHLCLGHCCLRLHHIPQPINPVSVIPFRIPHHAVLAMPAKLMNAVRNTGPSQDSQVKECLKNRPSWSRFTLRKNSQPCVFLDIDRPRSRYTLCTRARLEQCARQGVRWRAARWWTLHPPDATMAGWAAREAHRIQVHLRQLLGELGCLERVFTTMSPWDDARADPCELRTLPGIP